MSYESHTENILQLGNTIGHLKDNFEIEKCQYCNLAQLKITQYSSLQQRNFGSKSDRNFLVFVTHTVARFAKVLALLQIL